MSDKRKVSTDALETLGMIITEKEKRDAIHLAVLPVKAGEILVKGEPINMKDGKAFRDKKGLGIVDPFLAAPVEPGEYFWMVLKPRIIKSLRHVWSHPSFPDEVGTHAADYISPEKVAAQAEIESIAEGCDISPEEMIEGAKDYLRSGEYLCEGGRWEGVSVPDAFWPAFEIVTGIEVAESERGGFFSCSC